MGTLYKIRQVRLDELAAGAARVDFVKIDAEGAEEGVIAGVRHILARDRPGLILEFNAGRYRNPSGFLGQLQSIYKDIMHYINYGGAPVAVTGSQMLTERPGEDWLLNFDQASPSA